MSPPRDELAEITSRLVARFGELSRGATAHDAVLVAAGARVDLAIGPADVRGAPVRGRHASLRYSVREQPADVAELRATVARVVDAFVALAASDPRVELDVDEIAFDHDAGVIQGRSPSDSADVPCLTHEMRPPFPEVRAASVASTLGDGCSDCAVPRSCQVGRGELALLNGPPRPLKHPDRGIAIFSALDAICQQLGSRLSATATKAVLAIERARVGLGATQPSTPWECSLKVASGRLSPSLRFVDYPPRWVEGHPPRARLGVERRKSIVAAARALSFDTATLERWLGALTDHVGLELETSIGFDIPVDDGPSRMQAYAHLPPLAAGADEPLRALLRALLGGPVSGDVVRVCDQRGAHGALVLGALTLSHGAPPSVKLYLEQPIGTVDVGALAPFAPPRGLGVFDATADGLTWKKWDFPCKTHFQRAASLAGAFADGLHPLDAGRVLRILDGRAFAPWPTWLSVGVDGRALYFVPR